MIEERIARMMEGTGKRRRRYEQLLDDLRKRKDNVN
jgi:hypothetical protein